MKLKNLVYFIFLMSSNSFAQELKFEKEIDLSSLFQDKREVLPVINKDRKELALFLLDKNDINILNLDDSFSFKRIFKVVRPATNHQNLLGYTINDSKYSLIFSNKKKNSLIAKTIDIENKQQNEVLITKKIKGEKYLESFNYNGDFYLLTIKPMSSMINIYQYSNDELKVKKSFDLSKYKFNSTEELKPLSSVLLISGLTKIDNASINPIDVTSAKNKLFFDSDFITISIDNRDDVTKLIRFDIETFNYQIIEIDNAPSFCSSAMNTKANSYIYRNELYQVKGCKDKIYFSVKDIKSQRLKVEFEGDSKSEIEFRNTAFTQKGGVNFFTQGSDKVLDKTKQALKRINSSNIGISSYLRNGTYEIMLGGYKEVKSGGGYGGGMMMTPGMSIATPYGAVTTPATYSYNPTMYGFNSHKNTRSVYFKSKLSLEFQHEIGEISDNAFDKISDFQKNITDGATAESVFRFNKNYYYCFYNKYQKRFFLHEFQE